MAETYGDFFVSGDKQAALKNSSMSISSRTLSFSFSTFSVLTHEHKMTAAAPGITSIFPAGKRRMKGVCHWSLSLYNRKVLTSRLLFMT